jgi:hypothetical protein
MKINNLICISFFFILFISFNFISKAEYDPNAYTPATSVNSAGDDSSKGKHTPGLRLNGISLNDSELYSMPTESCKEKSMAVLDSKYFLTEKIFVFKTAKGFGVANIALSYKDLETGVRRQSRPKKKSCKLTTNMKLFGDFDCLGKRLVRKEPYESCAYEVKIWGHSMTKEETFQLVYRKLQEQFFGIIY